MKTLELRKPLAVLSLSLILLASPALARPSLTSPARDHTLASDFCPPLPPPSGNVVTVSSVVELQNAVNNAASGDTILVADGTYNLDGVYLQFAVSDVTMRSASGNREVVILDGNYETTEIVQIVASNVTIADLTLQQALHHPIHVMSTSSGDTNNTLIYNVHIIDPGQQAIKINPAASGYYPDNSEVACSHIELTDTGRSQVWTINGSCYTGGVDAHQAQGWTIRDNLIEGFWCPSDLSEHGIHLWRGCRDTIVERNVLRDNARGVGFGLEESGDARTYPDDPCPGAGGGYVGHYGGIIRNNLVFADRSELFLSEYGFDCGICLAQTCGAQVLHDTIVSTQAPFSSIEWRFANTDVNIINNLVSHNLLERDGATAYEAGNLDYAPLSLFVDGAGGDLHLAETAADAIDQGDALAAGLCDDDFDGDPRPSGPAPDVGADEYISPVPAAVTNLRVAHAITRTGVLTAALRWTAPTHAVTYTVRHSDTHIHDGNWDSAAAVTVPFTASAPGSVETLTVPVPYTGGTAYFALKSQNAGGDWSGLSNNAFWPHRDVHLPLILRGYGS